MLGIDGGTTAAKVAAFGLDGEPLLVDADLNPLTRAIIWQDQRCAAIAKELDGRYTEADKQRIWGGPIVLDASFVGARAEDPEGWRQARWILSRRTSSARS